LLPNFGPSGDDGIRQIDPGGVHPQHDVLSHDVLGYDDVDVDVDVVDVVDVEQHSLANTLWPLCRGGTSIAGFISKNPAGSKVKPVVAPVTRVIGQSSIRGT